MTVEFHRDNKRFIDENCKACKRLDDCECLPMLLGDDLVREGYDAEPNKFYFYKDCPDKVMG